MCDHLGTELDCRKTHICGTSSVQSASSHLLLVLLFAVPVGSLDDSDQQKNKSGMMRTFLFVQDVFEAVL